MKRRITNILNPIKPRRGIGIAAAILLSTVLLCSLFACTVKVMPQRIDDGFSMGSLFDHANIGRKKAKVAGLSADMTAAEMMEYYDLQQEDFVIEDFDAKVIPNADSKELAFCILNQCVFFKETGNIPWSVSYQFGEGGTLKNVGFSIRYIGIDWETAHESAMELLNAIDKKVGKTITHTEWMENSNYNGVVVNDFADPIESMSELNTNFMRQYMYLGSNDSSSFAVSMSYQDFSHADTTQGLGQNVEELFGMSITIPVR